MARDRIVHIGLAVPSVLLEGFAYPIWAYEVHEAIERMSEDETLNFDLAILIQQEGGTVEQSSCS
jgi:hypothetical protein